MKVNRKALKLTRKQLREIQLVELEMLIELDRICRENNIRYMLGGGTLLGAVRHKGFIPWDDDIDVIMLREEYNKFCRVCKTKLDTARFFLQTMGTDPRYRIGYAKIRRLGTEYVRVGQENMGYHGGIFIDILPFDNLPGRGRDRKKFLRNCLILRKILYSKAGSMCEQSPFKRAGFKVLSWIPEKMIKRVYHSYVTQYNDEDAVYVRCVGFGDNTLYYKGMFEEWSELEFEGHRFYCPLNYDMYLKISYGYDYMLPPPKEERMGHAPVSSFKLPDTGLETAAGRTVPEEFTAGKQTKISLR